MAEDNRSGSLGDGGSDNWLATDYHRVTLALETLSENYEAAQNDRTKHNSKTLFWARVAGFGVGLYALLIVGIVCASFYLAQQTKVSADAARHSAAIAEDTEKR